MARPPTGAQMKFAGVMPQVRVFLFFWRTIWDCPYCQDAMKVEEWIRKSYPNAVITHGGWREF